MSKNRKKLSTSHLLWTVFERSFIYYVSIFKGDGDQTLLIFTTKSHLISKCLFGVIVSTKIPTIFLKISVLASKKRANQKKSLIK